jgi:hypothetical protein
MEARDDTTSEKPGTSRYDDGSLRDDHGRSPNRRDPIATLVCDPSITESWIGIEHFWTRWNQTLPVLPFRSS